MFMEDCVNRVLPWKTPDGDTDVATFAPPDLRAEDLVAAGLGRDRSLTSALRELSRVSLQMAMLDGRAAFELAYKTDGTNASPVGFELLPIWDGQLTYKERVVVQELPERAEALGHPRRVEIPRDLVFSLPPSLVDRCYSAYQALLPVREDTPKFAFDLLSGEEAIPFDFRLYNNSEKQQAAKAVRHMGWDGRGLISDNLTEFYLVERQLRFAKWLAQARSELLGVVNAVAEQAGIVLGFAGRVEIPSGRSVRELEEATAQLHARALSFERAIALCF